ncbi:septal ring lytic transglycosylase RlpA family protein [Novosphingobium humi]|uniref:septal ring lytic transglycosylase RlpA family protein n=1 Tax=Novosphingobium humi TaxID=2282397 RepID=UPI0025B1257D|nr:RlpA-like double-psi beta-barrel domain-containing protein [Novosphingobium humi]WJS97603.1 SPOR domain-containing protein [Novosphingobium humi]
MRLPVERRVARLMLGLAVSGAALGMGMPAHAGLKIPFVSGGGKLPPAPAMPDTPRAVSGPAADYPVVLGEPYRVGDTVFSPANAMNYDAVGYASVGGPPTGVSAAHHTLPLPSYVEVTSLTNGRTILVRVERRGPMDSTHTIELSPAALAQLGASADGQAPVRVRRVNPLENERALLRAGMNAPERMPTPKPLLAVLQRRLATDPNANHAGASLATSVLVGAARDDDDDAAAAKPAPRLATAAPMAPVAAKPVRAAITPMPVAPTPRQPVAPPVTGASYATPRFTALAPVKTPAELGYAPPGQPAQTFVPARPAVKPPTSAKPLAMAKPAAKPRPAAPIALEARVNAAPAPAAGGFVVQYGAFSEKSRAQSLARAAGARIVGGGALWRVRSNAYPSRPAADAALAKAKAAGYTEARIQRGD